MHVTTRTNKMEKQENKGFTIVHISRVISRVTENIIHVSLYKYI